MKAFVYNDDRIALYNVMQGCCRSLPDTLEGSMQSHLIEIKPRCPVLEDPFCQKAQCESILRIAQVQSKEILIAFVTWHTARFTWGKALE